MLNAFLVVRTVFFALLTYFHVLLLVFASWNITVATSYGMSAPGASIFLLIDSVLVFVLVFVAYLAEVICARARPAQVRVECAWTASMSILQLAASIDLTMTGPPMYCQAHSPWTMCASSSLLVHVSWLVTLIIFAYCLTICIVAATHSASLPNIWIIPVPHVPWFSLEASPSAPAPVAIPHLPVHKHSKVPSSLSAENEASCVLLKYIAERWERLSRSGRQRQSSGPVLFTPGRQSTDPTRPIWARQLRIRRGVDDPFAKPLPKPKEPPTILIPPPRTHSRPAVLLRDAYPVERNEGQIPAWTPSSSTLASRTSPAFSHTIANLDLPIPRPDMSECVRADALSWISIETEWRLWS